MGFSTDNADSGQPPNGQRQPRPRELETVHQVIEAYLFQAKRELAPRTYHEMTQPILKRFDAAFGHLTVAEARPFDLQEFINNNPTFRSECTIRRVICCVKRAFNWALDMELITRNPFRRFRSRGSLPPQKEPMADEDFQTLLRYSAPAYRRFLIFLKYTGCRPSEACSLRWRDVRFEEKTAVLADHKTAKATGKPRRIALVPTVLKLLAFMRVRRQATVIGLLERLLRSGPKKSSEITNFMSHYGCSPRQLYRARLALGVIKERVGEGRNEHYIYRLPDNYVRPNNPEELDFVFLSADGNPLCKNSLNCWLRRVRARAGLPNGVTLYQIRHRWGFMGIKNKVNLKLLSLSMGHSRTTMTERYINSEGLSEDVWQAAVQVAHGPGAIGVEAPAQPLPIPTIKLPPIEKLPVLTEHIPRRYGEGQPRPNVMAGMPEVPLPDPKVSDPSEQSLESVLRMLMGRLSARPGKPRTPTSSKARVNPRHDAAFQAVAWALQRNPKFAKATDREVYAWLRKQSECPYPLPPTFATFARYLSAARLYHANHRPKEGGAA